MYLLMNPLLIYLLVHMILIELVTYATLLITNQVILYADWAKKFLNLPWVVEVLCATQTTYSPANDPTQTDMPCWSTSGHWGIARPLWNSLCYKLADSIGYTSQVQCKHKHTPDLATVYLLGKYTVEPSRSVLMFGV